jgi:hypothetical protein
VLENQADYEALALRIKADYRPRTNFELELVARLISLLWRLRRAVAIESGLFDIQAQVVRKRNASQRHGQDTLSPFYALIPTLTPIAQSSDRPSAEPSCRPKAAEPLATGSASLDMARSFMRVACDSDVFERLGRYEMRLWRQAVQTILLLNSINRAAKEYVDCDDKYLYLRNMRGGKRHRTLWPPFVASD